MSGKLTLTYRNRTPEPTPQGEIKTQPQGEVCLPLPLPPAPPVLVRQKRAPPRKRTAETPPHGEQVLVDLFPKGLGEVETPPHGEQVLADLFQKGLGEEQGGGGGVRLPQRLPRDKGAAKLFARAQELRIQFPEKYGRVGARKGWVDYVPRGWQLAKEAASRERIHGREDFCEKIIDVGPVKIDGNENIQQQPVAKILPRGEEQGVRLPRSD